MDLIRTISCDRLIGSATPYSRTSSLFSYISIAADRFSIQGMYSNTDVSFHQHEASIMLYGIELNNPGTIQSFRGQPSAEKHSYLLHMPCSSNLIFAKPKLFTHACGTVGLDFQSFSPLLQVFQ